MIHTSIRSGTVHNFRGIVTTVPDEDSTFIFSKCVTNAGLRNDIQQWRRLETFNDHFIPRSVTHSLNTTVMGTGGDTGGGTQDTGWVGSVVRRVREGENKGVGGGMADDSLRGDRPWAGNSYIS
jgi:hypothetical protein